MNETRQEQYSKTLYNKREWLNNLDTPSSGSVVCYHGISKYEEEKNNFEQLFLEIADCHYKIRLHKTVFETKQQFIDKLERLQTEIDLFIKHLKKNE